MHDLASLTCVLPPSSASELQSRRCISMVPATICLHAFWELVWRAWHQFGTRMIIHPPSCHYPLRTVVRPSIYSFISIVLYPVRDPYGLFSNVYPLPMCARVFWKRHFVLIALIVGRGEGIGPRVQLRLLIQEALSKLVVRASKRVFIVYKYAKQW